MAFQWLPVMLSRPPAKPLLDAISLSSE